jgi:hypothetical protein
MECPIFEIIGVYLLKIMGVPIFHITTKDPFKLKAWLGVQKWHLKVHILTLMIFFCRFNNYQIINPIIIPYAFNHKC